MVKYCVKNLGDFDFCKYFLCKDLLDFLAGCSSGKREKEGLS